MQRQGISTQRRFLLTPLAAALGLGAFGMAHAAPEVVQQEVQDAIESEEGSLRLVQVVSGLEHPGRWPGCPMAAC
ncbi:hypothetical protein [Halomonas sp. E19]|uniref:hypothetical protein n=1 Tax=Halomonas sp. E19 TaxID=3397247 RepID=UPI004033BF8C